MRAVKQFSPDGKIDWGLHAADADQKPMCAAFPSASFAIYRTPAANFDGMSDGIGAVRRAERSVEQTVEWLGND